MLKKYFLLILFPFLYGQEVESIIPLHPGANLVSFNVIPYDNSLSNIFSSIENNITGIISEGLAASPNPILGWVGSLSEIEPIRGYWIIVSEDCDLLVEGIPVDVNQDYELHYGANLISYPFNISMDLNTALPVEAIWYITRIIGEGTAASNQNGQFIGSLSEFQPNKGYWFFIDSPFILNYYDITTECDFLIDEAAEELEEIFFDIYNNPNIIECYDNLGENPWCIDELVNFDDVISLYDQVLGICPESESANFGSSMVNLMSIVNNGHFLSLIEKWSIFFYDLEEGNDSLIFNPGIGIEANSSSYTDFSPSQLEALIPFNTVTPYSMLFNESREEIPELQEVQEIIEDVFMDRVERSINRLERVLGKDYNFNITGEMQGDIYQPDIEMDDTEFYLLKSQLHFLKALFHIILTYDINGISLDFEDFLWMNQDSTFLTIRDGMELSMLNSYEELEYLHSSLESSLNFLNAETDWQGNDYINNNILEDEYDNILEKLNKLEVFIYEDYIFNDYICSEWDCYVINAEGNVWEIECDCHEGALIETTTNISNFMNNPSLDLKEHVPEYTIINSSCEIDGYGYPCPQLIWSATTYEEWYLEFQDIDFSINGLFPEIDINDVISTYFLLFNTDESTWSQTIGGN